MKDGSERGEGVAERVLCSSSALMLQLRVQSYSEG